MKFRLKQTLLELGVLSKSNIKFVLTRFPRDYKKEPDDLDILVDSKDFSKTILALNKIGYRAFSHDQALGGRIKGMQKNLVKENRIKIDLHQDFTWKKSHYLDLNLIWRNVEMQTVEGVNCMVPEIEIDAFIIMINTIFEKTYITKNDWIYAKKYFPRVFLKDSFYDEAKKYGWAKTYNFFKDWFTKIDKPTEFPVFMPISSVLFSYLEKLWHDKKIDVVSLMYYIFFRTRFVISKQLPYE